MFGKRFRVRRIGVANLGLGGDQFGSSGRRRPAQLIRMVCLNPLHQAEQSPLVTRCQRLVRAGIATARGKIGHEAQRAQVVQSQRRRLNNAPGRQRMPHRPVDRLGRRVTQPAGQALLATPILEGQMQRRQIGQGF